ncbi:MAG: VanZ family protein [Muribaculaceae bacterium]|nr:VanZ family protein [Muribaculaceae bacterium]
MRRFIRQWWPSALTLCAVLYITLSTDPAGSQSLPPIPYLDKLIHAIMMGGLSGAFAFDTARSSKSHSITRRQMLKIVVAVMVFSVADEWAQQTFTQSRSGEWGDIAADWLGCVVAFFTAPAAVKSCLRRYGKHKKKRMCQKLKF